MGIVIFAKAMVLPRHASPDIRIPGSPLTERDACAIFRLLGDAMQTSGGIAEKRKAILDGVGGLVGSNSWVWCLAERNSEGAIHFRPVQHGGFSEDIRSQFIKKMNHRTPELPLESEKEELQSIYGHSGGEGAIFTSVRVTEGGQISVIAFLRGPGTPPFDAHESRICEILLREIPWLHSEDFPQVIASDMVPLFPRHRVVLNLLRLGWSRNKIARHLGLSIHTVNGYAKIVFKHFGVHSQCELISRLTATKASGDEMKPKEILIP